MKEARSRNRLRNGRQEVLRMRRKRREALQNNPRLIWIDPQRSIIMIRLQIQVRKIAVSKMMARRISAFNRTARPLLPVFVDREFVYIFLYDFLLAFAAAVFTIGVFIAAAETLGRRGTWC